MGLKNQVTELTNIEVDKVISKIGSRMPPHFSDNGRACDAARDTLLDEVHAIPPDQRKAPAGYSRKRELLETYFAASPRLRKDLML